MLIMDRLKSICILFFALCILQIKVQFIEPIEVAPINPSQPENKGEDATALPIENIPSSNSIEQGQSSMPIEVNPQNLQNNPNADLNLQSDQNSNSHVIASNTVDTPDPSSNPNEEAVITTNLNTQVNVNTNSQSSNSNTNGEAATATNPNAEVNVNPNPQPISAPNQQPNKDNQNSGESAQSAERSARYRQQQQRLNQMRRRQRELDEKRRQEAGEEQSVTFQSDGEYSKVNSVKIEEKKEVHSILSVLGQQVLTFQTLMFEITTQVQQFEITPSANMDLYFRMSIYVEDNNIYGLASEVEESDVLKYYIYEDNNRIAAYGQFYFEKVGTFPAKKGSSYTIRFYNSGKKKLVVLQYPKILQEGHLANLYSKEKGNQHTNKVISIYNQIRSTLSTLRRSGVMNRINTSTVTDYWRRYSGYQIVEVIGLIAISAMQIKLIKRLFKSDSIL